MKYTEENIEEILSRKRVREKEEKIFRTRDAELRFLLRCLKYMDDDERDVIEKLFFEGFSVRKYAKVSGFSRNFINKQKAKSIELLTKFFNLKFN